MRYRIQSMLVVIIMMIIMIIAASTFFGGISCAEGIGLFLCGLEGRSQPT